MAIGKTPPMLDAVERVTGALDYMINLQLPDMLTAKVVRSMVPHAKLLDVNTDAAMQVPGVLAVLTKENLPTKNLYGVTLRDQPIVAVDRVRFAGEPLAVIAAEDRISAEQAAMLIYPEYEEIPAVFDAETAAQSDAPKVHETSSGNIFKHAKLVHGDLDLAMAESDQIFEDTFYSPVAQHASLEPHVAAAQWDGDALTVWSAAQAPYAVRRVLANLFEIPEENVRVIVGPLGGGYGGKGHVRIEPLVAAVARLTAERPVKLVLSREEEFVTVTKHAAAITLKTGVKNDGTLMGRQITIHWNGGAYADASPILVSGGMLRAVGPYRFKAVKADSFGVYTNLPPAAAYRGAMSSQATWAYESQMDIIARKMNWDPLEFRIKNLLVDGDTFATGETMHDVHFVECLDAVAKGLEWEEGAKFVDSGTIKVGRGIAVMMKSTIPSSKSVCRLNMDGQGKVILYTSTVEMGQGSHTALAQIAAECLKLPLSRIAVQGPDTNQTPFDSTTSASRSTNMMGNAVIAAAAEMLDKIKELAAQILEVSQDHLQVENGHIKSNDGEQSCSYTDILQRHGLQEISAEGEFSTKLGVDPDTGQGIATPHWHQGAGAVELSVDTETGKIHLLRYRASSFAGKVVNPVLVKLQNDGNVIFGLGPTLLEEVMFDGGQVTNPNFSDYMIPSIGDIPLDLYSTSLESDAGDLHGIGEMTLPPVAPAIAAAVEDAVGIRIKDLPITAEKILRELKEKAL